MVGADTYLQEGDGGHGGSCWLERADDAAQAEAAGGEGWIGWMNR